LALNYKFYISASYKKAHVTDVTYYSSGGLGSGLVNYSHKKLIGEREKEIGLKVCRFFLISVMT